MYLIDKKYVVVLGLAAMMVSGGVKAKGIYDDENICKAVWAANIGAPQNEVYYGIYARLLKTGLNDVGRDLQCTPANPASGGNCVREIKYILDGETNSTIGFIGFAKAGGGSVKYDARFPKGVGGHDGGLAMAFAVCDKNKSVDTITELGEKKKIEGANGFPLFIRSELRLQKNIIGCLVSEELDAETGASKGAFVKGFVFGPPPKYMVHPHNDKNGNFFLGKDATPSISEGGPRTYLISFLGMIPVEAGQAACQKLKDKAPDAPRVFTPAELYQLRY